MNNKYLVRADGVGKLFNSFSRGMLLFFTLLIVGLLFTLSLANFSFQDNSNENMGEFRAQYASFADEAGKTSENWSLMGSHYFLENNGQVGYTDGHPANDVKYYIRLPEYEVYFFENHISYINRSGKDGTIQRVDKKLLETNNSAQLTPVGEPVSSSRFYLGKESDGQKALHYNSITYKEIYEGVDLHFYIDNGQLKYDFYITNPDALTDIQFEIAGADSVYLDENQDLNINTFSGIIKNQAPYTYQENEWGQKTEVESSFADKGENVIGFHVGDFNPGQLLVIDPTITYATYYGGGNNDRALTVASDGSNIYIAGRSNSQNGLPVTSGLSSHENGFDGFVASFTRSGSLNWATYYGDNNDEQFNHMRYQDGKLYLVGTTNSQDFPVTFGSYTNNKDVAIVKLNSSDGTTDWATLIGGDGNEEGRSIDVNSTHLVVTGFTDSNDFAPITSGAYQTANSGSGDAFITQMDINGGATVADATDWSTYYGGTGIDAATGISYGSGGEVHILGTTNDGNFPVSSSGVHQTTFGGNTDAFVVKLDNTGDRSWATFYGGSQNDVGGPTTEVLQNDHGKGIDVDSNGNVYFIGSTLSTSGIASAGAYQQNKKNSGDMFIAKLNSNGSRQWGTYYGGNSNDDGIDIQVSPECGVVYFIGDVQSTDLPVTADAPQDTYGGGSYDAMIGAFDVDGNLEYTTYYGGTDVDYIRDITTDGENTITSGFTNSNNIPLAGSSYQSTRDNNEDGYYVIYDGCAGSTSPVLNDTYALNDINQTPVNEPVDGNVLTNDFDQQGDGQTVTSATYMDAAGDQVALTPGTETTIYGYDDDGTIVEAGTITLNADGSYDYVPATDFTGTIPLEYTITDDNATSPATDSATLTIEVTEDNPDENDPPLAQDDTDITEEGVTVDGNVLDNDSDPDGDPVTVTGATYLDDSGNETTLPLDTPTTIYDEDGNLAGEITLNSDGTYTFDPEPGFTGDVPVDYTIEDPDGLSDDATLTITVTPDSGNQTFASDDANLGSQGETLTGDIEANDFDPEGDTQTIALIDSNGDGTPNTAPTAGTPIDITQDGTKIGELTVDPATGAYTWTPEPDFVGTAVIPYETCDDATPQACATATLYLTSLDSTFTIELTDGPCWRTLSSPIEGETYQDFFARFRTNDTDYGGLWTQGVTGARTPAGGANVFTLDDDGSDWVAVEDLSQTIPAGTGVLMTVFDEDEYNNTSSAGFPKLAEFEGSEIENESPVEVILGTPNGTTDSGGVDDPDFQGFSMLGNPYKSTIDFNELTLSDVQQIAWIYDRSTGQWISWNGNSGDITNGLIAPGQGFVVQNVVSPAGTPSVTFPEAAKTSGGTFVGKQQNRPDFLRLEIEGEELTSSMWLEFAETGSFTKTTGDVIQLMSFESEYSVLSSLKEGQMYDIGRFPSARGELEIPVIAEVTRAGTYTIRATDMMLPAGAELYLHDLQTGDRELITEDMEYRFTINQAAKSQENGCFTAPQKAKASADNRFMITTASGMENPGTYPSEYRLNQNYPNPFNPSTQITYELPQQSDVLLEVFDMSGRQVATLVNESVNAGTHTVNFNATNLSSGVYMYRLQAGRTVLTKKLTLIK